MYRGALVVATGRAVLPDIYSVQLQVARPGTNIAAMKRGSAILGSAIFLVVAPGTLAVYVPWTISRWRFGPPMPGSSFLRTIGGLMIAAGLPVLLDSFARFAIKGMGTPAPVAAPEHLVVTGLYRYVRNPMYVAVSLLIFGQGLLFGSVRQMEYGVVVWLFFFAFVVLPFVYFCFEFVKMLGAHQQQRTAIEAAALVAVGHDLLDRVARIVEVAHVAERRAVPACGRARIRDPLRPRLARAAEATHEEVGRRQAQRQLVRCLVAELRAQRDLGGLLVRAEVVEIPRFEIRRDDGTAAGCRVEREAALGAVRIARIALGRTAEGCAAGCRVDARSLQRASVAATRLELERGRHREPVVLVIQQQGRDVRDDVAAGDERAIDVDTGQLVIGDVTRVRVEQRLRRCVPIRVRDVAARARRIGSARRRETRRRAAGSGSAAAAGAAERRLAAVGRPRAAALVARRRVGVVREDRLVHAIERGAAGRQRAELDGGIRVRVGELRAKPVACEVALAQEELGAGRGQRTDVHL